MRICRTRITIRNGEKILYEIRFVSYGYVAPELVRKYLDILFKDFDK